MLLRSLEVAKQRQQRQQPRQRVDWHSCGGGGGGASAETRRPPGHCECIGSAESLPRCDVRLKTRGPSR